MCAEQPLHAGTIQAGRVQRHRLAVRARGPRVVAAQQAERVGDVPGGSLLHAGHRLAGGNSAGGPPVLEDDEEEGVLQVGEVARRQHHPPPVALQSAHAAQAGSNFGLTRLHGGRNVVQRRAVPLCAAGRTIDRGVPQQRL